MKVLLITPAAYNTTTRWIPVGLGYIAASLKKSHHSVRLYDRHLQLNYLLDITVVNKEMKSEILSFKPDIIGFSTVSPLVYDTVETITYIRKFYDGIIIAGGHHATAMPGLTLENIPGLDYIAAGEAEYSLTELANGKAVESIPGIYTRNTDPKTFKNSQIPDLNKLPMPDYRIFDMNYYTGANHGTIRNFYLKTAELISSRGCSNNCTFCSESLTFGKGVRYHSSDYVIENIENLLSNYDINGLYFHDNDFLTSRKHAEDICRSIIKRGLNKKVKWAIQAGTNRIDEDILKLLSEAGCVKIEFGMESISEEHLLGINKNRSVDLNEKVIRLCKKSNIRVHSYFMTGFKGETISDLNNLILWIKKFKPHTFLLSQTKIYPGTDLYQTSGNRFFETNDWSRENITKYFEMENFSEISKESRIEFNEKVLKPFQTSQHRKSLIKTNTISNLAKIVYSRYKTKTLS